MEPTRTFQGPQLYRDGQERRAWPRHAQKTRVLFLAEDCALEEPYAAWIVDSSRGGVRLCVTHQVIELGTVLQIRSPTASDRVPWLFVRVKHRCRKDDHWELGCEFVTAAVQATQRNGWAC